MPKSRRLVAVPFIGKDVPSHASEFAHPDVLIGLSILAYRYEGLRMSDVRSVVSQLQRKMREETGPFSQRPASLLFDHWVNKGAEYQKRIAAIQQERKEG